MEQRTRPLLIAYVAVMAACAAAGLWRAAVSGESKPPAGHIWWAHHVQMHWRPTSSTSTTIYPSILTRRPCALLSVGAKGGRRRLRRASSIIHGRGRSCQPRERWRRPRLRPPPPPPPHSSRNLLQQKHVCSVQDVAVHVLAIVLPVAFLSSSSLLTPRSAGPRSRVGQPSKVRVLPRPGQIGVLLLLLPLAL